MKIETCFFVLTLGLCNLLKGIPSLDDLKRKIVSYNFYNDPVKIHAMCHVQNEDDGLRCWRIIFCRIRNSDFEKWQQIEISGSLLMLGVLQIEKEDEEFFEIIKEEFNILKKVRKNHPEDFEKANLGFTLEELEAEFNNRCEQARNRVQMKEKESSSERTSCTKKRKRTEMETLKP